jgi:hypothetical protein
MEKIWVKRQVPSIISILVGILSISILILYFQVPKKLIIGWGILSWILGVAVIKVPIYQLLIVRFLHPKLSNKWLGIFNGLVSSMAELGSAFIFFYFVLPENLTLPQIIGFGLAAGAVESIILPFMGNPLSGTPVMEHTENLSKKSQSDNRLNWMGLFERIIAYFIHIFSRGLVYISKVTGNLLPVIIAVIAFAFADGKGYYDLLEKRDFTDIKILGKFYFFLMIIALILTLSFVVSYRTLIQ